jgi:hypothetical protein
MAYILTGCSIIKYLPWKNTPTPDVEIPIISGENTLTMDTSSSLSTTNKTSQSSNLDGSLKDSEKQERATILTKRADYLATNNEYREASDLYERVLRLS